VLQLIKTIVSIEVDLAASRAIRFACQLGNFIPMEIHPVYIKEAPPRDLTIGSGWARRHWESELVQEGKQEISELITSEIDYCPVLQDSRVVYGDRDIELLKIMENEPFDLYVEGAHFSWNPSALYQRIYSNLFQRAQMPIALAPTLRKIFKLMVLCLEPRATQVVSQGLARLWAGSSIPVALAVPAGKESELKSSVDQARQDLTAAGCQVELLEGFTAYPKAPREKYLRDYGVVALALPREVKKDNVLLTWLAQARVPAIIMFY
jgi:hypothetical protein